MSNPYWWVWWATIGFAFMIQFDISFQKWPRLVAFFAGHEAGDLVWYLAVSVLAFFGIRNLNKKAYYGILVCCGVFMILFGLYLGASTFLRSSI
jgi:threonine/homoserine/homoserine lactone efflux protein